MSVKRGELIVGHIPRELSKTLYKRLAFSVVEARGGDRRVTGEIFRDSNGFGVFVGMIMTVPHGPGLKQKFFFAVPQSVSSLPCLC